MVGDRPLVDGDGLSGDVLPGEFLDAALASGLAIAGSERRVASETVHLLGESGLETGNEGRVLGLLRVVGHQGTRLAVHDDLGNPADRRGDDGSFAGHRLQIHDAQRLVHRRAGKHGGVGEHLAHRGPWQHLRHPAHTAGTGLAQLGEGILELGGDLRGVGGAGQEQQLSVGIEFLGGAHQVHQTLLARDASHEHHQGSIPVHTQGVHHVGVAVGAELIGVDAVLHHMDASRVELGVGIQHIATHAFTDRDHRSGIEEGRLLRPTRHPVPTAELFCFPRTVRLQGV